MCPAAVKYCNQVGFSHSFDTGYDGICKTKSRTRWCLIMCFVSPDRRYVMMDNCSVFGKSHVVIVSQCVFGVGFKVLWHGLGSVMLIFSVFTPTESDVNNFYVIHPMILLTPCCFCLWINQTVLMQLVCFFQPIHSQQCRVHILPSNRSKVQPQVKAILK